MVWQQGQRASRVLSEFFSRRKRAVSSQFLASALERKVAAAVGAAAVQLVVVRTASPAVVRYASPCDSGYPTGTIAMRDRHRRCARIASTGPRRQPIVAPFFAILFTRLAVKTHTGGRDPQSIRLPVDGYEDGPSRRTGVEREPSSSAPPGRRSRGGSGVGGHRNS